MTIPLSLLPRLAALRIEPLRIISLGGGSVHVTLTYSQRVRLEAAQ